MNLLTATLFTSFSEEIQADIFSAAAMYLALRDRTAHPRGSFDQAGRFFLDVRHECCEGLRPPSRNHPYPQMTHGRSLRHVCHGHGAAAYIPIVRKIVVELDRGNDRSGILQQMAVLLSKAAMDATLKKVMKRRSGRATKPGGNVIDPLTFALP